MFRGIASKEVSRTIEELNDDFIEVSRNFWNFSFGKAHVAEFGGPFFFGKPFYLLFLSPTSASVCAIFFGRLRGE